MSESENKSNRKGEVVLFNMNGDYMIARVNTAEKHVLSVRNLSQILPVPSPDGSITISIRPFFAAIFGLIKDKENMIVDVNRDTVSVLFWQEDLDPELVSQFISQTSGLAVPPSGLIMPSFSLGGLGPEPKKRSIEDNLPLGSDFLSLINRDNEDIDQEE